MPGSFLIVNDWLTACKKDVNGQANSCIVLTPKSICTSVIIIQHFNVFFMKSKLVIMAFALLSVAACRKSTNMVANTEVPSMTSNSAAKGTSVPFKGAMTYTLNPNLNLPCNCGALITVGDFEGVGNVTHMGLLKSKYKTCASPIMAGSIMIGNHVVIQCGSFTAANGDEVYVNIAPYDLMFGQATATGLVNAEFNGGTGRFTNATGGFKGVITLNYNNPNVVTLTNIDGTINY